MQFFAQRRTVQVGHQVGGLDGQDRRRTARGVIACVRRQRRAQAGGAQQCYVDSGFGSMTVPEFGYPFVRACFSAQHRVSVGVRIGQPKGVFDTLATQNSQVSDRVGIVPLFQMHQGSQRAWIGPRSGP